MTFRKSDTVVTVVEVVAIVMIPIEVSTVYIGTPVKAPENVAGTVESAKVAIGIFVFE
jgi:hypothetical protein